jgi:hypothetical protein
MARALLFAHHIAQFVVFSVDYHDGKTYPSIRIYGGEKFWFGGALTYAAKAAASCRTPRKHTGFASYRLTDY